MESIQRYPTREAAEKEAAEFRGWAVKVVKLSDVAHWYVHEDEDCWLIQCNGRKYYRRNGRVE